MLQKCCVRKCNGIIMGLFGTNTHMQQSGPRQLYIKIIHFFTFCGHDMARGCALPARAKCCRDFTWKIFQQILVRKNKRSLTGNGRLYADLSLFVDNSIGNNILALLAKIQINC